jgi:hypothetical protein
MASPVIPSIPLPATTPTLCAGGAGTVNTATAAGIYQVAANCSVTLDFSNGDVNCVYLVLGAGATVAVKDKKSQNFMTSYDFSSSDATALAAINALTPVPSDMTSPCPGAPTGTNPDRTATHAGFCIIWMSPTTTNATATLSNASTGNGSDSLFVGTVFLPGQTVNFSTNQAMEDVGQIYCGDWQVQSGNHPNPVVTYDNGSSVFLAETLRLAE